MSVIIAPVIAQDYQIYVQEEWYAGDYIELGQDDYCAVRFGSVGSPELRDATYDISGGDGAQFGVERYGMTEWEIEGAIHAGTNAYVSGSSGDAWNAWSRLARTWINYPGRETPRAVVPMHFKRPGRPQMMVFGRPGRIDPDTETSHAGFIAYTAQFRQSDPRFYGSAETSVSTQIGAVFTGAFQITDFETDAAFVLPFRTSAPASRRAELNRNASPLVDNGDADTSPVIEITGPVWVPEVNLYDNDSNVVWSIKLNAVLVAGDTVTIDTRNWARSITNSSGVSLAGQYVGKKLQDIVIPPKPTTFEYLGMDETGTSTCKITYRDAWSSI